MDFLQRLFRARQTTKPREKLSQEALDHVSAALQIIEAQVRIESDGVHVESAGSEGEVAEAARRLEQAHKLHPEHAGPHYAYASCLHLAAQYAAAKREMETVLERHPDFILAKLALDGWDSWQSPFTLPPWSQNIHSVHPRISGTLPPGGSGLYSVRDGYTPRAAVFLRDAGDFRNLNALRSARIDLATVISPVSDPQVVGIYGKVRDNPSSPFNVEVLGCPFRPPGDEKRRVWELLCTQADVDFVVIGANDRIMLNKRLPIPKNMHQTNQRLFELLAASKGRDISASEYMNAVATHQRKFTHADVRY